jgi:hypothetical protein
MKNIKDYLHLYLGCKAQVVKGRYTGVVGAIRGVDSNGSLMLAECNINFRPTEDWIENDRDFKVGEVQPILRHLNDITEEEFNEMFHHMDGGIELSFKIDGNVKKFDITPSQIAYLLSRSVDLFGLIEAGLAIDKTINQTKQ